MSDPITTPAEAQAELLKWAAVAGALFDALREQKLPERLCADLTYNWLALDGETVWAPPDGD